VSDFLDGKSPEALAFKGYTCQKMRVEGERITIDAVPIELATAYWRYWDKRDNLEAQALIDACVAEAIERRADRVFGIHRTEEEYNQRLQEKIVQRVVDAFPGGRSLLSSAGDSLLFDYYEAIEREIRDTSSGISGLTKEGFKEEIVLLSNYTSDWRLRTDRELHYQLKSSTRYKYPDLMSRVFDVEVDGERKRAVFIFQCQDPIVDMKLAKEQEGADYAFLFFVAPFGGTPNAFEYIRKELPEELRGFVNILSVKQVAQFLYNRICLSTQNKMKRAQIKGRFKNLFNYEVPSTLPLLAMLKQDTTGSPK
jgi:hypothetical protein